MISSDDFLNEYRDIKIETPVYYVYFSDALFKDKIQTSCLRKWDKVAYMMLPVPQRDTAIDFWLDINGDVCVSTHCRRADPDNWLALEAASGVLDKGKTMRLINFGLPDVPSRETVRHKHLFRADALLVAQRLGPDRKKVNVAMEEINYLYKANRTEALMEKLAFPQNDTVLRLSS